MRTCRSKEKAAKPFISGTDEADNSYGSAKFYKDGGMSRVSFLVSTLKGVEVEGDYGSSTENGECRRTE
jgi:hypothetical protein